MGARFQVPGEDQSKVLHPSTEALFPLENLARLGGWSWRSEWEKSPQGNRSWNYWTKLFQNRLLFWGFLKHYLCTSPTLTLKECLHLLKSVFLSWGKISQEGKSGREILSSSALFLCRFLFHLQPSMARELGKLLNKTQEILIWKFCCRSPESLPVSLYLECLLRSVFLPLVSWICFLVLGQQGCGPLISSQRWWRWYLELSPFDLFFA